MEFVGTEPRALAVTAEQFRRAAPMVLGGDESDLTLEGYLLAAQEVVETASGRQIGQGLYRFTLQAVAGWRKWYFPCAPVDRIEAARAIGPDGVPAEIPLEELILRGGRSAPFVQVPRGWGVTASGEVEVELDAVCGLPEGDRAIEPLRNAMILIAQDWLRAGFLPEELEAYRMSFGALRLIKAARYQRPSVMGFD